MTFAGACRFINNYSSAHESRVGLRASCKIKYPEFHIESDNRLSWMLGLMDKEYGADAYYIHLKRDVELVAASYNNRWHLKNGIMPSYSQGVLMQSYEENNFATCLDYVNVVNLNIEMFLKGKRSVVIDIDNPKDGFTKFWEDVSAEGDLSMALDFMGKKNNTAKRKNNYRIIRYKLSKTLDRIERIKRG